jgi:hypothetical protein
MVQSVQMEFCPICGNEITDGQVCWVCARADREQRVHGGSSKVLKRTRARRRQIGQAGSSQNIPKLSRLPNMQLRVVGQGLKQVRPDSWRRLEGFNRLLKDVYGEDLRLSAILAREGVPQTQLNRWRRDEAWLCRFVERLEKRLSTKLTKIIPRVHAQLVSYWYGLGPDIALPPETIAFKFGVSPSEVRAAHTALIKYLQGRAGRGLIEQIIFISAVESTARKR